MDIVFKIGAIDNLVKKLGIKKTEIYRKEEGAVISNKTMKLINDGKVVSFNTYLKLQGKYKLQQGVDMFYKNIIKNRSLGVPDIYTTSYSQTLHDKETLKEFVRLGVKNRFDYDMMRIEEDIDESYSLESIIEENKDLAAYEKDLFNMRLENFHNSSDRKKNIKQIDQKKVKELYSSYIDKIFSLKIEPEIQKIKFDDDLTKDFFYYVENPDRFYKYLIAENNDFYKNEWLVDKKALLNRSCSLDDEQKFQLLKKLNPDDNLNINKSFLKKVLKKKEEQTVIETVKILTDMMEKSKSYCSFTTSTNFSELLDSGEDTTDNSFWLNFYILRLYGLQIYFKKIQYTEKVESEKAKFKDSEKFIFYISNDQPFPIRFRKMPIGFYKFIKLPGLIPDDDWEEWKSFSYNGIRPSKFSTISKKINEEIVSIREQICKELKMDMDEFFEQSS